MPVYEFNCPEDGDYSVLMGRGVEEEAGCPVCGKRGTRIMSRTSFVIGGNPGPKLKTRVALDDELKKSGFTGAPLFSSEERKDKARRALKKAGVK